MATKNNAVQMLRQLYQGAALHDNSYQICYDVGIEAPRDHHWGDGVHERVCNEFNCSNKSEFWDRVIEDIKELGQPEPCDGECEYWG